MKFKKLSSGLWDSDECYECCSDCSACEDDCLCPLSLGEEDCSMCIFRNGYKKCSSCCKGSRTNMSVYIEAGFFHMCNECIKKIEENGGNVNIEDYNKETRCPICGNNNLFSEAENCNILLCSCGHKWKYK